MEIAILPGKTTWKWNEHNNRLIFLLLLPLLLVPVSTPVAAADTPVQVDWYPNNYETICDPPDSCQLSASEHSSMERNLSRAVEDMQNSRFRAPTSWGKRTGADTGYERIILVESGSNNVAYVSSTNWCNYPMSGWAEMFIGNKISYFLDNNAEHWVYNSAAHEVFHLVQYTYPFWDLSLCGGVPGWIMEGTATAVATDLMRKRFGSVDPSSNATEARQIAGLRRYDRPLPDRHGRGREELTSGLPTYQFTSSFWQHLASAFHKGKFDYLASYMGNTAHNGDWVAWLRNNVELDTGGHLGMVFSGFLADYSGWGDRGFSGEVVGRSRWLQGIFGGCEKLILDKNNASDYVDVDLKPLSGECIEVAVSALGEGGLNEGESAAVQIAAVVLKEAPVTRHGMELTPSNGRDGLHLSLVTSNDKKKFHCAREVKRRGKKGVGRCIFVPDDGKIRIDGSEKDARLWNVIAQEKDNSPELRQQQAQGKGAMTNIYTVSYTPVSVGSEDTRDAGIEPMTARFYFVLDVTKLELPGTASTAQSTAGKRVTSMLNVAQNSDPQTSLPKQDESGRPANSFALPANLRPQFPAPPAGYATAVAGKLSVIMVSSGSWDGGSLGDEAVFSFSPAEMENNKLKPRPLRIGETGNFPLMAVGNLEGEPVVGISAGSLDVEEFTDLVLRARYQATLCRVSDLKPNRECPKPFQVSGQVVKGFAGSSLPGNHMQIEDTPGMKMYRKANEQAMQQWSFDTSEPPPSEDDETGPPGSSSTTGGQMETCACTCEEREANNQRGQELKERSEDGEDIDVGAIMNLSRCSSVCQREYMICEFEKNEAEKAAARAKKETEVPADCDCSCEGLNNIESIGTDLQAQLAAGQTPPMDELMKIGQCMSVCQDEFSQCLMSP
jgi:hypothetical protein